MRAPAKALHGSERGAALVLALFSLLVLVIAVGFASVNIGLVGRGTSELQLAVDNAASSAASQLCSSESCYAAARTVAVSVISMHSAMSRMDSDRSLVMNDVTIPDDQFVWDLPDRNLQVTVERGLWHNRAFESFEGDWQVQHPGIPAFIAANAVRIQIRRPRVKLIRSLYGGDEFAIQATAVAVKGATETAPVAPFALPVCALINNQGHYYGDQSPTELCKADRYFTRADRFETISGATSAVMPPSFQWSPCNPEVANAPYTYKWPRWPDGVIVDMSLTGVDDFFGGLFSNLQQLNTFLQSHFSQNAPVVPDGPSCALVHSAGEKAFNGRPTFPQPNPHNGVLQLEDHFGVVGVPGEFTGDIEGEIRDGLLGSQSPLWYASVGDTFKVLQNGLASPNTESLLWDAIVNGVGGVPGMPDGDHPALGTTPIGTFAREVVNFSKPVFPLNVGGGEVYDCEGWLGMPGYSCSFSPYLPSNDPALLQNGVDWSFGGASGFDGACNSKWMKIQNLNIKTNQGYWRDEFAMSAVGEPTPGLSDNTPVWHIPIPIIADSASDAPKCYGLDSSVTEDPIIDPRRQYTIIGFVEGYIFDLDIGHPQPRVTFTYPGGYTHNLRGWGYMEDNPEHPSAVTACNTVRARLACKRWFVPDSSMESDPVTAIVQ